MGRHSPQKREYDNLAKECFESRGYEVEFVGGRLADLVAWSPSTREFSIVEVKSPREPNAQIHFESEKSYSDVGGITREQVWELIKNRGLATQNRRITRLIAFTLSNQLYTYWLKADQHIERFRKKTCTKISPDRVRAFAVFPIQQKPIAMSVLELFSGLQMVENFSIEDVGKVCVIEISYPPPKPK